MDENQSTEQGKGGPNLVFLNLVILVVFLLIVVGAYYWVAKKGKGQIVFPAGINYLSPNNKTAAQPTPMYDYTKLAESADWITYKGKIYPFTFQHPKALTPLTFANDQSDAVTFKVSDTPPELRLMLNIETVSSRDKNLVGKAQEFARNYWKFFSGLQGLNSIESVTNEKGMAGFKANYVVKGTKTITSDNYFFSMKVDNDHIIHVANIFPPEGQAVFNRLVNSIDYQK